MDMLKRSVWLLLLIFWFLPGAAQAVTLSTSSLALLPGETAVVTLSNVKGTVRLSNTNPGVASATLSSSRINVTAKAVGSTTISARDKRGTASLAVTVKAPMSVSPASLSVVSGQAATLTVSNASGVISVSSSDTSKVTATVSGSLVTATGREAGSATLTVRDSKRAVVVPVTVTATSAGGAGSYALVAWNDLGMHCMDADYSVFSILPPYNNLHAQLVNSGTGKIVTAGVSLTYQAEADPDGSKNSRSWDKSNFWTYVKHFFVELAADMGLAGNPMASDTPQPLAYDAAAQMFKAEGIPITPYDDSFRKNPYPLVRVVARDSTGNQLASARVVLPVSDEMSCKSCHATNSNDAAKPSAGWIYGETAEREYRLNILRLHDQKAGTTLYAKAMNGTPTLCASCHASNALPGTGVSGVKPLTESMHASHAKVIDPSNGLKLDDAGSRGACYQCHPGSETKCLRGAMSGSDMQCQSCHGRMSNVGASGRVGWLDQPNCQACHYNGQRQTTALLDGVLRKPTDTRFATNPDTPKAGFSLYRMSKGHGGLQCEACHGATHAEYAGTPADPGLPGNHYNDNLLSQDLQGHAGTVAECRVCHATPPLTTSGGPHGMHTTGQIWVKEHHDRAKGIQSSCAYCHGADYRGSALATIKTSQTFGIGDGRSKTYTAGQKVGCYDCHNGPSGD